MSVIPMAILSLRVYLGVSGFDGASLRPFLKHFIFIIAHADPLVPGTGGKRCERKQRNGKHDQAQPQNALSLRRIQISSRHLFFLR